MAARPPVNGGPPHSEPGRTNWYIATTPSLQNPAVDSWFKFGLGANDVEILLIEEQIRKECEKFGILKVLVLDGTTTREPYRKAQDNILRAIQTVSTTHEINLKNVPDKWLIAWTRTHIQKQWQRARDDAKAAKQAKEDSEKAAKRKGIRGTISGMSINVTILPPGGGLLEGIVDLTFPSISCVLPDLKLSLQDTKNYQLGLMRKAMENKYTYIHTVGLPLPLILNARHGQLSYQRAPTRLKLVDRQQHLETALIELHHNRRDDDDVLQFYFNLESASQQKTREAREAAGQRTRDTMQANREALAKLAGEELKATPTRLDRLVRETPRPSTSMGIGVGIQRTASARRREEERERTSMSGALGAGIRTPAATSLQARRLEDELAIRNNSNRPTNHQPPRTLRPSSQQVSRPPPSQTTRPSTSPQTPIAYTSPPGIETKRFVPIKHIPRPKPEVPVQESSFSSEGSFKTDPSSSNGPVTKLKREMKRAVNIAGATVKDVADLVVHPREKALGRTVSAKGLKHSNKFQESQNGLPSIWRDEWSEVAPGVKGKRERRRIDEPDKYEKNDVLMEGLWEEEKTVAFAKGVGSAETVCLVFLFFFL